jgi:formate/nitrite transporter
MRNSKQIVSFYESAAAAKVSAPAGTLILSGVFSGAFIAFGAFGSQIVNTSVTDPGLARLLGAMVFPVGLAMVLCVGTELFTGNSLLFLPLLEKKISARGMLRNWGLVYLGNLIGSLLIAVLISFSGLSNLFGDALRDTMANTAASKASLAFFPALIRGILCNILVCLAVWMSFGAEEQAGKILGLFFPTMAFVLCGFEHSIANMYFIPAGMLVSSPETAVSLSGFLLNNLLPVTIGNVIGGALFVAAGLDGLYGRKDF